VASSQLPLPLLPPVGVVLAVILRVDDDASLLISQVRDDITPTLVIVDAQRDDEVLAGVRHETKRAGRSATAHREHVGSVDFGPSSAIGILPNGLLHDVKECIRVGLVDLHNDRVCHF